MKYTTIPYFRIDDLEDALEAQYGSEFIQEVHTRFGDFRCFMFGDLCMNDICCIYYIDEIEEYEGHFWQNEARIRLENCIKTFLRDMFPNFDYVLVEVMW